VSGGPHDVVPAFRERSDGHIEHFLGHSALVGTAMSADPTPGPRKGTMVLLRGRGRNCHGYQPSRAAVSTLGVASPAPWAKALSAATTSWRLSSGIAVTIAEISAHPRAVTSRTSRARSWVRPMITFAGLPRPGRGNGRTGTLEWPGC
jgi:hypothetical protein